MVCGEKVIRPVCFNNYLVVVRAVGALFNAGVLLLVPDLDANDGVHVETCQLPGFNYSKAHLKILRFQGRFDYGAFQIGLQPGKKKKTLLHKMQMTGKAEMPKLDRADFMYVIVFTAS